METEIKTPRIKTTYQTITPIDDENYKEECGFEDETGVEFEPDEFDIHNGHDAADLAIMWLKGNYATEPSSSFFHTGIWYSTYPSTDCHTGEETSQSFHLKGFTPEQERKIYDAIVRGASR